MTYHFTCIKEGTGYWGHCLEFEGCTTQGSTLEEYKKNCKEALELRLEDPLEVMKLDSIIEIEADPKYTKNEKIVAYA